jgi:hypothetical protein
MRPHPLSLPLLAVAASLAATAPAGARTPAAPVTALVDIRYSGGLCVSGATCEARVRLLPDGRLLRDGKLLRVVSATRVTALRKAIARLDLDDVRAHPFTGTCPIAYDGQEATYRFRGVDAALRSCRWDLERVPAVQLVGRTLAGR